MKKIIKKIYDLIPFKKELFSFIKTFWKPGETTYRHLHFKNTFTVSIDNNKKFKIYNATSIENEIFWEGLTGKWEKESLKLWIKLCKDSKNIFDLGSNTGIYSLVARTVNPNAKVYAFEPHPIFFEILEKNIKINSFDIFCYKTAVSNFNGNLPIEDYSGISKTINVESVTLDTFIEKNKIENIDLMKIDVETHEPQVMEGFLKHLSQFKPTLIIEILNNHVAEIIFNFVRNHNYLYFNIDERGGIRQTERIEKSDYFNYLLCNKEVALRLGLIENGL